MEPRASRRRRGRIALAAAVAGAVTAAALAMSPVGSGHVAFENGRFRHQIHGREYSLLNSVDNPRWRRQTTKAQRHWQSYLRGTLSFPSTRSRKRAVMTAEDSNWGATGWAGYARGWHVHGGRGHLLLNTYYLEHKRYSDRVLRMMACHEIGHFAGLAHSQSSRDCMYYKADARFPTLGPKHRDELRSAWRGHPARR